MELDTVVGVVEGGGYSVWESGEDVESMLDHETTDSVSVENPVLTGEGCVAEVRH